MSLARQLRNLRLSGWRQAYRDLAGLGDIKAGTLVGVDRNGNQYFENLKDEIPGRHRWIDYHQLYDSNVSQIDPEWHSWLHHIRKDPPAKDEAIQEGRQSWIKPSVENLTGTPGAFKTYSTTAPKINSWQPKVAPRA
ncbi:NDUFA12-domain-containing protein [Tilletiaria anomala UBC 951]|uniref:NADH dehydrogenase [ubiquinone] 1 alpha subcomplex subunit n=1 Tax=Tilletiaria anomala (strain ATCC 24038 / CBS 436.72 / UBC 951) TaxID=1037660 RepID=A0A066VRE4_TILAU|nr:NDUFA12-domain-containing protein [Tilletiaria anomala UBC 951]KDN41165.1 NDUFA12-domain-containing protein [Tilletiaria anomala UBC 951]